MSDKILSLNALDGGGDEYAGTGKHLGLYIIVTGTNKAGEVGAPGDVGRFLVTRNGDQKINLDFADIQKIMNTRSGISILDSTDGGDFEASGFIPFFEESFPNCLDVNDKNELKVEYQPAAGASDVFDDLRITIWSRKADYAENYNYRMGVVNASYPAAIKSDPVKLGQSNISAVYVDDADDVLESLALETNRGQVQGTASELVLRAQTLQENSIESETFDYIKIPVYTPGKRGSLVNQNGKATISTTGQGNVKMIVCSVER